MNTSPQPIGHFGPYGGRYVAETLMPALTELEKAWREAMADRAFIARFNAYLKDYVGRPTPLTFAANLTRRLGGAKIYLKREDLCHTGAHKVNNTLGQVLLADRMGKNRIIAETGAGQHGVATATMAALFDKQCIVFMGEEDIERQKLNVLRMKLLGAEVRPVSSGSRTLKDAMNEALRDWVTYVETTYYVIGTVAGPHPYPQLVRDFQRVIGDEAKTQLKEIEGRLPDAIVACIGGGSNAMGVFHPFVEDKSVALIGVEAGGLGVNTDKHAASIGGGRIGVLHGNKTYLLQDRDGQIQEAHSISAGLDYPGVGPEHAWLADSGRATYVSATDDEAMEALKTLASEEGIIPALESAHAIAEALRRAPAMRKDQLLLVNLSGRGDKDMATIAKRMGDAV